MLRVETNRPLSPLTTFKVGGPAKYFIAVHDTNELQQAIAFAREKGVEFFVLAGGSNVIIHDRGFDGLVIMMAINSLTVEGEELTSGASTDMKVVVDTAINHGLQGLEWAGGLPGSFGGAIRGNAGAFGGEIKDNIRSVTSLEASTGRIIVREQSDCQFGYRESRYKQTSNEIIIQATLVLQPGQKEELRKIADDHIAYRHRNHPMEYPCAGSIFKNTPVEVVPEEYLPIFHDSIKTDPFPVVPTAKIIAESDLSGFQIGQAAVSTKHTNYIVNLGGATAADIVSVIEAVKARVWQRYQIRLELEPQLVGFPGSTD